MKPFRKRYKKIIVDGFRFHCVIDEFFRNKLVTFRVYPYNTKTSFFEVCFSWKACWHFNLNLPSNCIKLIQYAIQSGWEFNGERKQKRLDQGDFLIEELSLKHQ